MPPNTGICRQVNLEFLARVVESRKGQAFPDTLVGTDSHTTMVNGLGVLGWGVGGIEAEAAMLGESISMLVPQVVGFRLHGQLPEGATATDLVLTVTQILRETGVVRKFVEYFGEGLLRLPLADRAMIGNMSPEYGATCGFFPVDDETLRYLRLTGREEEARSRSSRRTTRRTCSGTTRPSRRPTRRSSTRPLDRRALARRPATAAGQDRARRCEARVPPRHCPPSAWTTGTRSTKQSRSPSPRATRRAPSEPGAAIPEGEQAVDSAPAIAVVAHRGDRVRLIV